MQPNNLNELSYLAPLTSNPNPYPCFSAMAQNSIPPLQVCAYTNLLSNLHINPQIKDLNTSTSCFSSNSTSDEADEQQLSIINERKQRRMISNRESARRSRMRKQRHLDELWSQVLWLRNENHGLVDKLNHVTECHDKAMEENVKLKEETSELRQMITDLQLGSCPYSPLRALEAEITNAMYKGNDSSI